MAIISRERLLKVLFSFNPWWTTGNVPRESTKPVKRFAYYEADKVLNHPTIRRSVILSGARRVGKTTILYQLIEDLLGRGIPGKQILYVSLDHPILKFCTLDEVVEIYETNVGGGNEDLYFFFDEVHYAHEWDRWLKYFYDHRPTWKIVATGSASPVLAAQAAESGVGRWTVIRIPTLSFYEYCELINVRDRPKLRPEIKPSQLARLSRHELDDLMRSLSALEKYFHRYLLIGGFPEIALSDDLPFAQRILREDVVDKVLKRDLTALFGVRNVAELEKVFLYLCIHSGGLITIDTLAKEIGVARQTVSNYLSILEAANLIYISNPVEISGKKTLKAKPKVYIADAAIRNAVLMADDVLTDPDEMGIIVETAVYKHVAAFYYRQQTRVGYYRQTGKADKEIDIVVDYSPVGRLLIEVKYREDAKIGIGDAIVEVADDIQTAAALVITKRPEDYGTLDFAVRTPIIAIPAFAFLYLLGHAEKHGYLLPGKT
ncbi:ATP-binding protein [Desulforudis sp. DRI-14]|uniref:ATP-binding protein n=1 Tax=Desulforudis sp. DRI-14 TaxID=3459793 RepID=UPI0040430946